MLEEAYEAVEAIDNKDSENLKEELGDVLLQTVFHSQLAGEKNDFDILDVINEDKDRDVLAFHFDFTCLRFLFDTNDIVDDKSIPVLYSGKVLKILFHL